MNKAWWKESVIYQVYPRSFCDSNGDGIGDLKGITSRLDYLKELGINVIWMSPIYKSPNDDNGYDISDYQDIMDEFGTMEDFDVLLAAAHERGIKIVMDLVVNHTSDEHAWFVESRSSKENSKRDFYIWRDPKDGHEPNNWGSCFSGPAWEFDEKTGQYYLHCFSRKQPDLNWENPEVRNAVFDMMTWWCDKGIDGFRMDVISMISKYDGLPDGRLMQGSKYSDCGEGCVNGPHVHEYLQEMNKKVLSKYDLMTVGECAGVTIEEAKKYANSQGTELSMVFHFEHMTLDRQGADDKWSLNRFNIRDLKENLSKWQYELQDVAWNSLYFCNHDQPRIVSRLGDDSPVSAKCIATLLHFMQGTPYVYQGEELGMTNCPFGDISNYRDIESLNAFKELTEEGGRDPEELLPCIAFKSRDNARTPMQWDDSEYAGFSTSEPWIMVNPNYKTINAKAEMADKHSVFHHYKKLIALRRNSEYSDTIVYGTYKLLTPEDENVFSYIREGESGTILVICNMTPNTVSYKLPGDLDLSSPTKIISNVHTGDLKTDMELRPWFAAAWKI